MHSLRLGRLALRRNSRLYMQTHRSSFSTASAAQVEEGRRIAQRQPRLGPDNALSSHDKAQRTNRHTTSTRFSSLDISANSKRSIRELFGYEYLTEVQEATINSIVEGNDMLCKARTGTGKTIAFLLPSIENIAEGRKSASGISCLVVTPTRELAFQIAADARKLCEFHGLKVEAVVGGISIKKDLKRLAGGVDILVATTGRLLDHAETTPGFLNKLETVSCFVLDEADQMLGMGFRPHLLRIDNLLPNKDRRQTLLFSATVPNSTKTFASTMMKESYDFIDTVGESAEQTNALVTQQACICEFNEHLPVLHALISEHVKTHPDDYKIIVFFSTAKVTAFNAQLFTSMGMTALEMHSKKSQSQRTKISKKFREQKKTIMFSSDVSARGVDYPDVTMCIQVGITTREQYIHRVGRTARAGQSGLGVLLLSSFETAVLKELKGIPIEDITAKIPDTGSFILAMDKAVASVATNAQLNKSAQQAYRAWLGFYKTNIRMLNWNPEQLVNTANQFSNIMGLEEIPALKKNIINKMGLRGVGGIRIDKS